MKKYFYSKLSDVNFRMSIHEGDANKRLTSEAENISILTSENVPEIYKSDYEKLIKIIDNTLDNIKFPLTPYKIKGIQNRTAAKYIKLLIDIEYKLKQELSEN